MRYLSEYKTLIALPSPGVADGKIPKLYINIINNFAYD